MASSPDVKVSVEVVLHRAVHELAQDLFDTHGITLHDVHIDWLDVSSMSVNAKQVQSVRIISQS